MKRINYLLVVLNISFISCAFGEKSTSFTSQTQQSVARQTTSATSEPTKTRSFGLANVVEDPNVEVNHYDEHLNEGGYGTQQTQLTNLIIPGYYQHLIGYVYNYPYAIPLYYNVYLQPAKEPVHHEQLFYPQAGGVQQIAQTTTTHTQEYY